MQTFARLSRVSRGRKVELFNRTFCPSEKTRVLDVGAEIGCGPADPAIQLIDVYPWKHRISAINLSSEQIGRIRKVYPEVEGVTGDICEGLPWPDGHFDVVYCNAVIEHLGTFSRQKELASEIMRVGRGWFVTTPNRWYPFEFHSRVPFVTWLPFHGYRWASRIVCYSHTEKKYKYLSGLYDGSLRLMSAGELRQCFPESRVVKQRVTFMAETLIAIGRAGP